MQKLLLISVLLATFVIPAVLQRRDPERGGVRRILAVLAAFTAFYVLSLLYIYPRLS